MGQGKFALRVLACVVAVASAGTSTAAAAHTRKLGPAPQIQVLSNRADLISGGDALVAVRMPKNASTSRLVLRLGSRNVKSAFAVRQNGQFEALLTGLANGPNILTAALPRHKTGRITIVNHPNGGPVFAGPQVQPWVCKNGSGDPQCNAPTTYSYEYKSSATGQLQPYDPNNPPQDVATTTTDQGVTVPFIIRIETGYQDRDQYQIAQLFQPGKPWTPWDPQKQWNHKLLITHGASCGIDHQSSTAPSPTGDVETTVGSPTTALGRGFATMATALDNAGHNCNLLTEAESLIMAKEHLVEAYGTIRYTIGTGCSGGSLVQQQVANAYPGVYQGILPQCSFPDAWSTGQQLSDYHLDRLYFENPTRWGVGVLWTPDQIAAVEGHPNHANPIILDSLYWTSLGDPTNACAGVSDQQRYNPQTNPNGVRCTLADYMVNVFGKAAHGFAGRPLDNVGVEYGLGALKAGQITPAQFVDLNTKIGGSDLDLNPTQNRVVADQPALANAYKSGAVNETNNLRDVAIIDLRGTDQGEFHDVYRAFATRARLEQQNGTHANQVIWQGVVPLVGDPNFTTQGLLAMDQWLSKVEKDAGRQPLSRKIIADKPADVHDQCTDGAGQVIPNQTVCQAINPVFSTPRIVAGESIATDQEKCRLEPLNRSAFLPAVQFTDDQWAQLQKAFPGGVCNWAKPGVDQRQTIAWQTYQDARGNVIYGGRPLGAAPAGSGGGWTSAAFASWLSGRG